MNIFSKINKKSNLFIVTVFFICTTLDMLSTYYIMPNLEPNKYVYEASILVREYGFKWPSFLSYIYGTGIAMSYLYLVSSKKIHINNKTNNKYRLFILLNLASYFLILFFSFQKSYAAFDNLIIGLFISYVENNKPAPDLINLWIINENIRESVYMIYIEISIAIIILLSYYFTRYKRLKSTFFSIL